MSRLALLGGERVVPRDLPATRWPEVGEPELQAVAGVLDSGQFSAVTRSDNEVARLEREWADRCAVRHCVGVASGTAALAMALAAVDVGPGDEVVVPALSFVASGLAPLHVGAVPVFVDVDPTTYTMDPAAVAAAVGSRTRALLPVHLHGLPADLAELREIAARHGLAVVEDAAQAHAARYRDRPVGSWGDAGAFSLNPTKNLPSCGEGGLITTDRAELSERLMLLRQFGERLDQAGPRRYVSTVPGWNHKLSAVQAAFTRAQLSRFDAATAARSANVTTFLDRIGKLPGVVVPGCPVDRTHAWHILRIRFDPGSAGLAVAAGPMRAALHRALRAEGAPVQSYQRAVLPDQPMFADPGRAAAAGGTGRWWPRCLPAGYRVAGDLPVARAVIEDSVTIQRVHLAADSGPRLERYAEAFEKVWQHLDVVARIAQELPYRPPWQEPDLVRAPGRPGS